MIRQFSILAAASLLAFGAHAATAVSASMSLGGYAEVNGISDSFTSTDAWGAPLSSLSIGGSVLVVDSEGRSVSTHGFGNAGWASANAGGVSFEGYGWEVQTSGASSFSVGLTGAKPDWLYTFVAGASDTQFNMGYNVFSSGNTFGLQGWSIFVDGGPQGTQSAILWNAINPDANGVFSAVLTPGQQYSVRLENNANVSGGSYVAEAQMNGNFRWEIVAAPVPEPETYALMALGLVAVGAVARRRRAA